MQLALADIPEIPPQHWKTEEPCEFETNDKGRFGIMREWLITNRMKFQRTGSSLFYEMMVENSTNPLYVEKPPDDYDFLIRWEDIPEDIRPPDMMELNPEGWNEEEHYFTSSPDEGPEGKWRNLASLKFDSQVNGVALGVGYQQLPGLFAKNPLFKPLMAHRAKDQPAEPIPINQWKITLNFIICLTEVEYVTFKTATEMFLCWMDQVDRPKYVTAKDFRVGFFEGIRTFMFATLRDDIDIRGGKK